MRSDKRAVKTVIYFTMMMFFDMFITMVVMGLLASFVFEFGLLRLEPTNFRLPIVSFGIISIAFGTFIARIISGRTMGTIRNIGEASKRVAKGDFEVQLDEDVPIEEIRTMAQNFNLMVRELNNTEMLRSDFIENVSHEFKTPLSSIEGYVTLLQNKNLPEEKREEYMQKILANTKRLSSLTGNILLLSRLENQEIEIKKESYPLDEQLRQTVLMFQNSWGEKELELDIELEAVSYAGNAELLSHVWQNIFGNAVKFTERGGTIGVYLNRTEDGVCVRIKDSGIGMDADTLKRIYEKFYQGERSRSGSGNGLGMALAKRIVDLHGGRINITSEKGKGSEFTVILPNA